MHSFMWRVAIYENRPRTKLKTDKAKIDLKYGVGEGCQILHGQKS